jgi:hypothetical protein
VSVESGRTAVFVTHSADEAARNDPSPPAPRHPHYRDVCFATLQSLRFERTDQIAILAVR